MTVQNRQADPAAAPATSRPAVGRLHREGSAAEAVLWQVPEEIAVALLLDSQPYTVMMGTPADLDDFALGFALSEGILDSEEDLAGLIVMPVENGYCVDLALKPGRGRPRPRRTLEGRSGCGLCGVEDIADVVRPLAPRPRPFELDPASVRLAFAGLPAHQPMNRLNHSVHAAAWCDPRGHVLIAREDVGRHNALDKLIGAMARSGADPRAGFAAMTSRCSFELVQKCATVGIPYLATLSAPTSLALELAARANLGLAAAARDGIVLFG